MFSDTNNLHLIIQCRYSSRRLPGKALLPFLDSTLLGFLVNRLKSQLSYPITIITSNHPTDDQIVQEAKKLGVAYYRGPLDQVFSRYRNFLNHLQTKPDFFARITADNPLTCTSIIKELHSIIKTNNLDYIQSAKHPIGLGVDLFKTKTFLEVSEELLSQDEQEHINLHFLNHQSNYQLEQWSCPWGYQLPESVTIDTQEQYRELQATLQDQDLKQLQDFRILNDHR